MYRKECYRTKNTCGECISDLYAGDEGDSNNACIPISTTMRSTINGTCLSVSDCDAFQQCLHGSCVSISKPCTANCSYPQGTCMHVNKDTGEPVTHCYVGSSDCVAVCDCLEEYIGSDTCSLNSTEILERRALRSQVLDGIKQLVALENADQQTVEGWIGSIVTAAQVSDELSADGINTLLSTVQSVLTSATQVGMSVDQVYTVLQSVDNSLAANVKSTIRRRRLQSRLHLQTNTDNSTSVWRLLSTDIEEINALKQAEDTITQFNEFTSNTLLPGQDPVTIVLPQFRLLVQSLSLLNIATTTSNNNNNNNNEKTTNITIAAPKSNLEKLQNSPVNSISIPINSNGNPDQLSLNIALTSIRSELFNRELSRTGANQLFSNPLTIELSDIYCTEPYCRMELVLQTPNTLSSYNNINTIQENFTTICNINDYSKYQYICSDNTILSVSCDGIVSVITSRCPSTTYIPVCNALTGFNISTTDCYLIEQTGTNITCSCPMSTINTTKRKLQSNTEDSQDPDTTTTDSNSEVSVSYVAMLSELKNNFIDTVVSAQNLNNNTIQKSWSALVTVGVLTITILFGLYWSYHADKNAEKIQPISEIKNKVKNFMKIKKNTRRIREKVRYKVDKDVAIAEKALPSILSSNSLYNRIKDEIKHHHKWFGIVFFYSRGFPRILRVLSLATNIIIMLFIQSLTYTLTNNDDGSCELNKTEIECISTPSPYATGESKCYWYTTDSSSSSSTSSGSGTEQCALVQPDSNMKVILFVAIFSALLSTPFAILVDYIIMNILAAPTKTTSSSGSNTAVVVPALAGGSSSITMRKRGGTSTTTGTRAPQLTSILPITTDISHSNTNTVVVVNNKRTSTTRAIFGSVLGLLTQTGNHNTTTTTTDEHTIALNAHADMRKLVTELTAYRNTLTQTEKLEFDGNSFFYFIIIYSVSILLQFI